jgi:hypothetical protein
MRQMWGSRSGCGGPPARLEWGSENCANWRPERTPQAEGLPYI